MQTDTDGGYVSFNCALCDGSWLPPRYFNAIKYSRKFDVDAFTALVKSSVSDDSSLVCPSNCGQLKRVELEGLQLDYCTSCRGIWFDKFEVLSALALESTNFDNIEFEDTGRSGFWSTYKNLSLVQRLLHQVPAFGEKPIGHVSAYFSSARYALGLMLKEKEIFFFALLQWLAIGFGYLLWVQVLSWVPEDVWRRAGNSESTSGADLVLIFWSVACIGIAAYPVGLFSGCMGACHFLRRRYGESSIRQCLELVEPRAGALWAFHWFDGLITCERILDRLPKKNDRRTLAQKLLAETQYYAWKVGVAGILPALLTGSNLLMAAKESVYFVKENLAEVAKLRAGYSTLCWIFGIGAYIGSLYWFIAIDLFDNEKEVYGQVYEIYLWATVPIMVSLAFVMLVLRPVYLIALCDMYSEYLEEAGREVTLTLQGSKIDKIRIFYAGLCAVTVLTYIFRYELGVMKLLSIP